MIESGPIIRLDDLAVHAGGSARNVAGNLIQDVSLDIEPGECVLLCGPSGAGKTMVTQCINGIVPHFELALARSGEVEVCGHDPAMAEMYELADHVGSVFQNPKSQFFNPTSTDELAFGLEASGADIDYIERRVNAVVADMGIQHLLFRDVNRMSGGEKQSLALASVAVSDPDVYVLDEPTANLDESAVRVLHDQLQRIRFRGKTIVISEHRLYSTADLIDRAILLENGRIKCQLTAEELRNLDAAQREELGLRAVTAEDALALPLRAAGANGSALRNGLSLRNFTCRRKRKAVSKPVDLDVPRGRVVGIMGSNGTGKTSLLRAVCGLEKSGGRLCVDGRELDAKARRKCCAMVMQDVNHQLFSDSVLSECLLAGCSEKEARAMLASLDLGHFEQRHPMALSGGQKQRLAIACTLLSGRGVLVLDEPTSELDLVHMREVSALVRRVAESGVAILVVSHDCEFVRESCDSVFYMERDHDA